MTTEKIIKANLLFQSFTYDKDSDSWLILFEGNTLLNITAFWRLLVNNEIWEVSLDHGHLFGHTKPVDLVERMVEHLTNRRLTEIKIKNSTGDLILTLTDNYQIEVLISSSGYESYNLKLEDTLYVGMGGGEIAIFDDYR
jgi:hypothetical protein